MPRPDSPPLQKALGAKVVKGGREVGQFDAACDDVRQTTGALCAAVVIIDGDAGSGYSVVGPLHLVARRPAHRVLDAVARQSTANRSRNRCQNATTSSSNLISQ
jgi:hypothetical protein